MNQKEIARRDKGRVPNRTTSQLNIEATILSNQLMKRQLLRFIGQLPDLIRVLHEPGVRKHKTNAPPFRPNDFFTAERQFLLEAIAAWREILKTSW
jgi:hypothetical protein